MIIQEVVDEVLTAFKETGLIPAQGDYYMPADEMGTKRDCACAIGVLTERKFTGWGLSLNENGRTEAELDRQHGEGFAEALEHGFDGTVFNPFYNDIERNGYDTGRAIWLALNPNDEAEN